MKVSKSPHKSAERRRFIINGAVQGVGFRPFVYKLAHDCSLAGWVNNTPQGVVIEVEGAGEQLALFRLRITEEKPPNAVIDHVREAAIAALGETEFKIVKSAAGENVSASILPDLALCTGCLAEMNDPNDRRYRYPFINCTHCGPRYTIIENLPYDRPVTTMKTFDMCDACRAEYENPLDRRFHAQPVACPDCGPQIALWNAEGNILAEKEDALQKTAAAVRAGKIVALKGLGGFHLITDAQNDKAVQLLRERRHRPAKPFAVMYSSLEEVEKDCAVGKQEAALLHSAQSPIVLLERKAGGNISAHVAPDNPNLGVMLPYTPLHVLLLQELKFPVIATSGNRADEPICIDEHEALERLRGIADVFLVHNRPIARRADDSIVRVMAGGKTVLRRARGYAPMPVIMRQKTEKPVLATGGHLKNTVALMVHDKLMLGPHVGNLETPLSLDAHNQVIDDLCRLYRVAPEIIARDKHPDYASTRTAGERGGKVVPVQHHYAHALACMVDNDIDAPCLAVTWDGTGYGDDGTIWGGEFLKITDTGYDRAFSFLPFPLAGGEQAVRDPRRAALGALYALGDTDMDLSFSPAEKALLLQSLEKKVNCPLTSSVGRLFDAVSALLGLCDKNTFEGEAAMALEFAAEKDPCDQSYPYAIKGGVIDWRPILMESIKNPANAAARFHNTLSDIIIDIARQTGEKNLLLTGGCFQNKLLLESSVEKLKRAGFAPFWHHKLPPNDGGIAAGQILAALRNG